MFAFSSLLYHIVPHLSKCGFSCRKIGLWFKSKIDYIQAVAALCAEEGPSSTAELCILLEIGAKLLVGFGIGRHDVLWGGELRLKTIEAALGIDVQVVRLGKGQEKTETRCCTIENPQPLGQPTKLSAINFPSGFLTIPPATVESNP